MRLRLLGKLKAKKRGLSWQSQLRFLLYLTRNNSSLYEKDFEGPPHESAKYGVFFLTRLWEDKDSPDGLTKFSQARIELAKVLKTEFGSRFHGGVVRNHISERYCSKDLLYSKVSRREFTRTLRESDIAVCTLGIGKSTPWKLGEAIAAAKCIVSESLFFELPMPLEEGVHLRTFRTTEDCLQACEQLFRDPRSMKRMKEQVWGGTINGMLRQNG